jgi:hypothetical protein
MEVTTMSLQLNDGEAVTFDAHGNVIRRRKWKDEKGNVLRDGEIMIVPMMMTDGKPKPTDAEVIAAANAVKYDAASIDTRPRAVFTDAQKQAAAERQAAYDRRISEAYKHVDVQPGTAGALSLATSERNTAERMRKLATEADMRAKDAPSDILKSMHTEQAERFRKRADAFEAEAVRLETPVKDASKLTATMNALGALGTENAFKAATAAGDPPTLDQARQRYHQRLERSWQEGNQ